MLRHRNIDGKLEQRAEHSEPHNYVCSLQRLRSQNSLGEAAPTESIYLFIIQIFCVRKCECSFCCVHVMYIFRGNFVPRAQWPFFQRRNELLPVSSEQPFSWLRNGTAQRLSSSSLFDEILCALHIIMVSFITSAFLPRALFSVAHIFSALARSPLASALGQWNFPWLG